jgi:hypothetical protein
MIEKRDQAKTVPCSRLVGILGDNFLKGCFGGSRVLFGDAALAFGESGDGVRIIGDGVGHGGSAAASDLFGIQVAGDLMAIRGSKLQGAYTL